MTHHHHLHLVRNAITTKTTITSTTAQCKPIMRKLRDNRVWSCVSDGSHNSVGKHQVHTPLNDTKRPLGTHIWAVHMLMSPFKLTNGHIQLFACDYETRGHHLHPVNLTFQGTFMTYFFTALHNCHPKLL